MADTLAMPTPYYQHDGITIFHGDCREILPTLPKVDLVLTDPPYGCGRSTGAGQYGKQKWDGSEPEWDAQIPAPETFALMIGAAPKSIIWGGNYFPLPQSRNFLVWDKGAGFRGRDFAECELAWCSWDGNAKVFNRDPLARGDYKGKEHPTQKPVAVMVWCLSVVPDAASVLDPFVGSGSTLVASKRMGRQAIGIEIEEKYCEIAARRVEAERLTLFEHVEAETGDLFANSL
jgi:DNA modification methylase